MTADAHRVCCVCGDRSAYPICTDCLIRIERKIGTILAKADDDEREIAIGIVAADKRAERRERA